MEKTFEPGEEEEMIPNAEDPVDWSQFVVIAPTETYVKLPYNMFSVHHLQAVELGKKQAWEELARLADEKLGKGKK